MLHTLFSSQLQFSETQLKHKIMTCCIWKKTGENKATSLQNAVCDHLANTNIKNTYHFTYINFRKLLHNTSKYTNWSEMMAYVKNTLLIIAITKPTLSARNNEPWSYIKSLQLETYVSCHFWENLFPEIHSTNGIIKWILYVQRISWGAGVLDQ